MNCIYKFLGGRTTAFALAFFICGTVLAFKSKLTVSYVSFGASVIIPLLGKSVNDAYHERNSNTMTTTVTTGQPPAVEKTVTQEKVPGAAEPSGGIN